ncbi:MAG TPA: 1-deoxy-D-xylulose-5-phosphate reductoisomerase [Longimicrobiales bacterium]|nr:1-deoxy-D-xylulose-5-phosphate reductoisomerase [Longimicrobiales bacterium]
MVHRVDARHERRLPLKGVAVLGSTGSIGKSALAVLDRHRDEFRVVALAANSKAVELAEQVAQFKPKLSTLVEQDGTANLIEIAQHPEVDVVINAIVGAAGLQATLAALGAGKRLALANKESLVAGGPLVMRALRDGGGDMTPVDSEHSAVLQCLRGAGEREVRRIILTASGGPFRNHTIDELQTVTREDAMRHPTWDMGAKITVDCATLANKALEVIEAHFFFGLSYDRIQAVVHPQSIVHSMVEFEDRSVMAQMGFPNMELPILYALTHPRRIADNGTREFDPLKAGTLTFEPIDTVRFGAFRLGVEAGRTGGNAPAVYNAANEVAVAAFLANDLPFSAIPDVIESALEAVSFNELDSLEDVHAADAQAREIARDAIVKV